MKDREHVDNILSEMIAQLVDEETNSNDLAFLMGAEEPLTEEQKRKSMISEKYSKEDKNE